jgi:hypothetical protein
MLLLDLEISLQYFEKSLTEFGLPQPTLADLARVESLTNTDPVVIREEKDYYIPQLLSSV